MKHSVLRDIALTARHETRLVLGDPSPATILLAMPVVLILFLKNGLVPPMAEGEAVGNGANQAVPGIATMFAFFLVGYTGLAFIREHGWRTWDRIRVSPLSTVGLIIGKAVPYLVIGVIQICTLMAVGWLFLNMTIRGSIAAMVVLAVLLSMAAVSLGLLLTALVQTAQQLYAVSNLAAVVLGGIGGAFAPVATYPAWAQAVAHATPQFWAIAGFQRVMLAGSSLDGVLLHVGVLLVFSVLFTALAALRFDVAATKQSFLD